MEEDQESRKNSATQRSSSQEAEDEKLRLNFLSRKQGNSTGLRRLRNPRCSLAAFSELSLSRSSLRFDKDNDDRVRVEYYVNENTVKERLQIYFFKNQRSSLRIRILRFCLKLFTCILYILRVIMDNDPTYANCYGCPLEDKNLYLVSLNLTDEEFLESPVINWDSIVWVNRPVELWIIHIVLSVISFSETILLLYLNYKGNIFQQILTRRFALELATTLPFIGTMFFPKLINLFVPVFLNCWLAKYALEHMFNDLHRAMQRSQSALSQQLFILSATLICLVFTSVCGVQHFQRAGHRRFDLFQAFYFVVVTFSTVGFGDYVPDIWPSQLFMVVMICVALIVLPTQFEQLAFTWMERQKLGGSYSSHRAHNEHHVVVCSTTLHADTIMDFLNEFFAHPILQDFYVVLLSPMELDPTMRMILQVPIWAQRVIYIQGSCLKDADLIRARMGEAEACFILAARNYQDKSAADEHTILRSWAVKDFGPSVPQYVQIFRPENKLHVRFAEHVVCEDEFKYALLSNNCLFPGTSTLVTLLLHTSRGREGETSKEEWQRLYGKCSGNEIYHIRLGDSRFFGEYEGKSLTYASFHSHRKYGVCLVGVRPAKLPEFYEDTILLNPGPRHIMKKSDICFYLSITKEEHSAFISNNNIPIASSTVEDGDETDNAPPHPPPQHNQSNSPPAIEMTKPQINEPNNEDGAEDEEDEGQTRSTPVHTSIQIAVDQIGDERKMSMVGLNPNINLLMLPTSSDNRSNIRRPSILPVPESFPTGLDDGSNEVDANLASDGGGTSDEAEDEVPWMGIGASEMPQVIKGFPPVSPYIGVTPTLCYLLREKKPLCCLQLAQACEHSDNRNAFEYNWKNRSIILAADSQSNAIYNFIVPLRAHFRPKGKLNPIILLLEAPPNASFLDAISNFPMIYWMRGSIDKIDDLLRAGITLAESVVVVNKELSNSAEEDTLADCNTIVAVQTMFRFFPHVKIVTELSQSNNMRFMQFRADDTYALMLSRMEKREKERGSHISYMFRLPFACGSVFSASMLDTLLYQAFVKDYLITFVRLLLGIDQSPGSGFLTSMQITKEDLWIRTYGRLYQKLCSTTCEIPIGIYRTQDSQLEECEDYYETNSNNEFVHVKRRDSAEASGGAGSPTHGGFRIPKGCFPSCGSEQSSFSSTIALAEETRDTHTQLIERAEMNSLIRSRMESNGLPYECEQQTNEKRISHSYVIINPSCDLKLRDGDVIYLIRPSPFSAAKTFERHNSRRKSTMHMNTSGATPTATGGRGETNPPALNIDDLNNKNAYALFQEKAAIRRRSSGSSVKGSFPYTGNFSCGTTPIFKHHGLTKSNSISLPESPRGRSNSLRISQMTDDILVRRSNSLRIGLGGGLAGGRRFQGSHDEIGLPSIRGNSNPRIAAASSRQAARMSNNGRINFELTPPEPPTSPRIAVVGQSSEEGSNQEKSPKLQGTIV